MTPEVKPNDNAVKTVPEGTEPKVVVEPAADTRAWMPEKLKGHKSLEKFKTAEDALTGYINLEGAFGKKFEEHLKADAPDDVKARVRGALGVPEAPAGYDAPAVPDGHKLDETLVGGFREIGHKAGLSKGQFKTLTDWFINMELERSTKIGQDRSEAEHKGMETLTKEWGAAAPRNIALCQQVVAEVGGAELAAYLNESGATNDPRMVKFLTKLGGMLQEDKMITPNPIGISADDAKAELAKIRGEAGKDKKHPYLDKNHPEHKAVVQKVHELTQLAFPAE